MYGYETLFNDVGERIYTAAEMEYFEKENRRIMRDIEDLEEEKIEAEEAWRAIAGEYMCGPWDMSEEYIEDMPEDIREACRDIEEKIDYITVKIELLQEDLF